MKEVYIGVIHLYTNNPTLYIVYTMYCIPCTNTDFVLRNIRFKIKYKTKQKTFPNKNFQY